MTSTTYTPQPLYGGAIKGLIPKGWLDASNLRQIPDHQELYLSPTTLSTLIYEINEYVPDNTSQETLSKHGDLFASASAATSQNIQDRETLDKAAILYHILDIHDNDNISKDTIRFTAPITSVGSRPGTGPGRVYTGRVELGSDKDAVICSFVVVRLEEQGSDLVVWGNVPVKEFASRGDQEGLRAEEGVVGGVVEGLVGSNGDGFVVVEWDLFG
ncbi:hypothetical protein AbraIFM66950_002324 [Aspergillus brasiliensis]|nr:hypothetical protein AbraIFM66950_002324 [Aspergillus brasiliensis]